MNQSFFPDRRQFLKKLAATLCTLPFASQALASQNEKLGELGLILNTVKNEMKADYKGTLEKIVQEGYTFIEGGSYGDSAKKYRRFLKKIGLKSLMGGSSISPMSENLDKYLRQAEDLHYEYLVCYWPWMHSAENLDREQSLVAAEDLNRIGKQIKEAGFQFAWHNHDKEFKDLGGGLRPVDIIMENTDPSWVNMEVDLYWVRKGNADPVPLLQKYPGRFPLVHVKDMDAGEDREKTCVGSGIINFARIFQHKEKAGMKHLIVEQESATDGIRCMQSSYRYLRKLNI